MNINNNADDASYTSSIFDDLAPLELTANLTARQRLSRVYLYGKIIDSIYQLSWAEHTADWDPFIIVTTNDGEDHECENGECISMYQMAACDVFHDDITHISIGEKKFAIAEIVRIEWTK